MDSEQLKKLRQFYNSLLEQQRFLSTLSGGTSIPNIAIRPLIDELKQLNSEFPGIIIPLRINERATSYNFINVMTYLGSAIGRLRVAIEEPTANTVTEKLEQADNEVNNIFDRMKFHTKIIEASGSLFKDGHYAPAILEAFKAVNNFVKQKTGKSLDGKALMSEVFSERNPYIKLNDLKTQSDLDEQEGFKFLYMGAMVGIRNPKAHDMVQQKDPYKTLEYLAFASLLIKRIDFWQIE
jgi:uncharacterized protein (TIGR02391 family)